MQVTLLGNRYEANLSQIPVVEGQIGGKYRGQVWTRKPLQKGLVSQTFYDLKYRDVKDLSLLYTRRQNDSIKLTPELADSKNHPPQIPPEIDTDRGTREKIGKGLAKQTTSPINFSHLEETFNFISSYDNQLAHLFWLNLLAYQEIRVFLAQNNLEENAKKMTVSLMTITNYVRYRGQLKIFLKTQLEKYQLAEFICQNYQLIIKILFQTLKSCLKEKWTLEIEQAWTDFSEMIISLILEIEQEKSSLQGITSILKKLKIKAIAKKASRDTSLKTNE